ncbi:MAG: hypothetical protein M3Y31_03455, partial [Gemmatimonadota bacterium]|nr:hypothetical protein [Gemmatimonadota bacterium]
PVADVEEQPEPVATATMAPVAPRRVTRFEDGFVDPVEAALSFDAPAPIELDEPRRAYAPARTKFMMVAAGLVFAAGAGLIAWSPWSGGPAEAVAASQPRTSVAAPSAQPTTLADVDMSSPAEEDPAPSVYDVPADADLASRTSFGGTAAPGDQIAAAPADPGILPSAPKTNRVAVPVVGVMDPRDSALEQVKRAALVTPDSLQ